MLSGFSAIDSPRVMENGCRDRVIPLILPVQSGHREIGLTMFGKRFQIIHMYLIYPRIYLRLSSRGASRFTCLRSLQSISARLVAAVALLHARSIVCVDYSTFITQNLSDCVISEVI